MAARVTQQIVTVVYTQTSENRNTAIRVEVLRSVATGSPPPSTAKIPVIFIIT